MVKVGVEKKGILFKINLEEMTDSEYDTEQITETQNKTI